ncbi:MAG: DnaJ domain-containing protein [Agriterribacter sp.]
MDFKKDYYQILGLSRQATKEDIKAAYRSLAKIHHPDKNPDDEAAAERFRNVQEAYDILFNEITRITYDTYRDEAEKIKVKEKQESRNTTEQTDSEKVKAPKAKTYFKRTVVKVPKRIYVSGKLKVKYWGDPEEDFKAYYAEEINYKIHATEVELIIEETSIFPFNLPLDLERIYTEAELFYTPIAQPVHCTILTATGQEKYDLTIHELKVIDPLLKDIVKYEKQSLGTLTAIFYGYVVFEKEEEIIEEVTEYSGETGVIETKTEKEESFVRRQYYHADGKTFWSSWQAVRASGGTSYTTPANAKVPAEKNATNDYGCAILIIVVPLILLAILAPQVLATVLGIITLWVLIILVTFFSRSILKLVLLGIIVFSIIAFFKNNNNSTRTVQSNPQHHFDSASTQTVVSHSTKNISNNEDTLVRHHLRWMDVDSNKYEMDVSIPLSGIRNAESEEQQLSFFPPKDIQSIYATLENMSAGSLGNVYANYDSIKRKNALSPNEFASMVVSSIQSLPYYLILDGPCNPEQIKSAFVSRFLSNCQEDCCVGEVPFGVRAPVAFFRDLKGDCDTRALLLYHLLRKAGYDVVVFISEAYHHAMLGIALPGEPSDRFSILISGKRYYFWETTGKGYRPGDLPPGLQNLHYWKIGLINRIN